MLPVMKNRRTNDPKSRPPRITIWMGKQWYVTIKNFQKFKQTYLITVSVSESTLILTKFSSFKWNYNIEVFQLSEELKFLMNIFI